LRSQGPRGWGSSSSPSCSVDDLGTRPCNFPETRLTFETCISHLASTKCCLRSSAPGNADASLESSIPLRMPQCMVPPSRFTTSLSLKLPWSGQEDTYELSTNHPPLLGDTDHSLADNPCFFGPGADCVVRRSLLSSILPNPEAVPLDHCYWSNTDVG